MYHDYKEKFIEFTQLTISNISVIDECFLSDVAKIAIIAYQFQSFYGNWCVWCCDALLCTCQPQILYVAFSVAREIFSLSYSL